MSTMDIFLILLGAGLMLVGAEVFIPGGVLGTLGGIALLIAIGIAFGHSLTAGIYAAVGVMILLGIVIVLWIRFFPRTRIGRRMTVSNDLSASKAAEPSLAALTGKAGRTTSVLRPSGFADIEGRRVDVITNGEMLDVGTPIRVLRVEGNRVIVEAVESTT